MIPINFIYSIGFRCYAPDFLKNHNIRNISGPFDWGIFDIETAFANINNNFDIFLKDIVVVNKSKKINKIFYSDKKINKKIIDFINKNEYICYMAHNYHSNTMVINQNFINETPSNLYYWDRICMFRHTDITEKSKYDTVCKRIDIFKNIYKNRTKNMCLFYVTRIIETENIGQYQKKIYDMKKKYNINCYIIIIICSDRLDDNYIFENDILFIIKKVDDYSYQVRDFEGNAGVDGRGKNDVSNGDKEYNIIKKIFCLDLMTYEQIISKYAL